MKIVLSLLFLALSATAAAADGPGNLGMTRGALVVGDEVLFVSAQQGDGPCVRPCTATPFLAAPGAVGGGLWTLIAAEGGAQWAYDGAPLYLWPEIGANHGRHFYENDFVADYYGLRPAAIKDPVGEGFAVLQDDPQVASGARIERRTIVNYGLYNDSDDTGTAEVRVCVDQSGRSGPAAIAASSGSPRLDDLTLEFAQKIQFVPARSGAGAPLSVCGVSVRLVWTGARQGGATVAAPAP